MVGMIMPKRLGRWLHMGTKSSTHPMGYGCDPVIQQPLFLNEMINIPIFTFQCHALIVFFH